MDRRIWRAWLRHLGGTMCLAPARGHPAALYQNWDLLRYFAIERAEWAAERLEEGGTLDPAVLPALHCLHARAGEVGAILFSARAAPERAAERMGL